jgi:citrate lyase subunit gamma (acyl carrier protein)
MEMKIDALAGTLESSDVMVRIGPAAQPGIQLEIDSIVKQQFGAAIEQVVRETLAQLGVSRPTWWSMIKARWSAFCALAFRLRRCARRNSLNCNGASYETTSQYAVYPRRQCRHVKHVIRLRR